MKQLKALLVIVTACMILPSTTFAQAEFQANAGGGIAIFSFSNGESESETGGVFGAGGLAAFSISDDLYFTGGVSIYFNTVSETDEFETVDGEVQEVESTLNYLNLHIPLGIRYHFTNEFYGHFALQPILVLNRSGEVDGEEIPDEFLEGYNDFEFSLPLGLGYRMDNGLDLSLTFDPMLTNMIDIPDDLPDGVDEPSLKRHTIRANVGFFF